MIFFALIFTAFRVFRVWGGVDDLFAIRFTAFTVFRAFPPPSTQIHNIQSIQNV